MNSVDMLIILGVAVIVAAIGLYLKSLRKKGNKCVGCPHSAECCKRCEQGEHASCGQKIG